MKTEPFADLMTPKEVVSGGTVPVKINKKPAPEREEELPPNMESSLNNLFESGASGTGEEELLRIASDYALQLSARQIRALLRLKWRAAQSKAAGRHEEAKMIIDFADGWLLLKKNNFSDKFVMRALDAISLRHYIGENAFKVDIRK